MHDMLPHNYQCELLNEFPGNASNLLYFPGATTEGGRDGLIVRVTPEDAEPWTGVFTFGDYYLNEWCSTPIPTQLCVIAKGTGFLVNVLNPADSRELQVAPIRAVFQLADRNMLIFNNFTDVFAWNSNGLAWKTDRLASDDLEITRVDSVHIYGRAFKYGRSINFIIDTETGKFDEHPADPQ